MTEPIEIVTEENENSRFATPREMVIATLISYIFCLFSTTGPIISLEIAAKTLTLAFLYFAGRNSQNALSGFFAATICAAYPHFHTFTGFSEETISLVAIAAILAALSTSLFADKDNRLILFGGALFTGLSASLSGLAWMPLFIAAGVVWIFRGSKAKTRIISTILFASGLIISIAMQKATGTLQFPELALESQTPLTLSSFFDRWSLPLSALLLISLVSAFFFSKEITLKSEYAISRNRDLTQFTILLIAAIIGAFISSDNNSLLIIVPFSISIGTTVSSGLKLFRKRYRSSLGHIAIFGVLLWSIVPGDILVERINPQTKESPTIPTNNSLVLTEGLHNQEDWGAWTTDDVSGTLYLHPQKTPCTLSLTLRSAFDIPRTANLYIDDRLVWTSKIEGKAETHSIQLTGSPGEHKITLSTPDGCTRPSDISDSTDNRCIAFGIEGYELTSNRYELGTPINFLTNSDRPSFGEVGFSEAETWGVWTVGNKAGFTFELGERPVSDLSIKTSSHAHVANDSPNLKVRLLVNGSEIDSREIGYGSHYDLEWVIPSNSVDEDGKLEIIWAFDNPMSPKDLGSGEDTRQLGLALRSLTISEIPSGHSE